MIQRVLLAIFLLFPKISSASETLKKGDVLKEDSVVFTIDEATRLKNRMFELEKKEKELAEMHKLCEIKDQKIDLYKINEEFYKEQIESYKNVVSYQDKKIENYQKIDSIRKYKETGYFILGISVAVGSIIVADKVNDSMQ